MDLHERARNIICHGGDNASLFVANKGSSDHHLAQVRWRGVPNFVENISVGTVDPTMLGGKGDLAEHPEACDFLGLVAIVLDCLLQRATIGVLNRESLLGQVVDQQRGDNRLPDALRVVVGVLDRGGDDQMIEATRRQPDRAVPRVRYRRWRILLH
ncbi:hypothetical protein [Phreatobacter sp. AB_2022a]|uniref:hypothetical protein n=1 Tax=Phreatobacter sp. AB_2022a TaxID=3003134 RepID=UPI002286EBBE|nr:hypothetical protein [Phreatobacter sp. AB_2022a]MCZ0738152.1 hypothetical protein [Phreatobacter sp. AB_2022a]